MNSILLDCNNLKEFHLDNEATSCLKTWLEAKSGLSILEHKEKDLLDYLVERKLIDVIDEYSPSKMLPDTSFTTTLNTVWLELRKACNMKCIHCYNDSEPFVDDKNNILSVEDWKDIIVQLKEFKPYTIVLIGGEPLMYKGVAELMEFVHKQLPSTNLVLYSNLSLLDEKIIDAIIENKVKVVTSIYSSIDTIHDSITQVNGSHKRTVENIKKLRQKNVEVKANTVIMSVNENEIKATREYIRNITGYNPKSDVIRCVKNELAYLKPKKILNPHNITSKKDFNGVTEEKLVRAISGNACWQGKLNIACNGYVSPCIMWECAENIYNLKKVSLKKIMDEYLLPTFWVLSKDYVENCKDCEFRYICPECRPLAQSLSQKVDGCNYNPYTGEWTNKV